ncbi:hypothetical protein FOZ62_031177, partial [Perkinsus olseni]
SATEWLFSPRMVRWRGNSRPTSMLARLVSICPFLCHCRCSLSRVGTDPHGPASTSMGRLG